MKAEFEITSDGGVAWTPSAVTSLIGQRLTFEGRPAEVVEARMDSRGRVFVTLRLDRK